MSLRVMATIHAVALCHKACAISPKMGEIPYGGVYIGAVTWVADGGRMSQKVQCAERVEKRRR